MLRRHICLSRVSDFVITCNFFAYFKFHSDGGRVIDKIKLQPLSVNVSGAGTRDEPLRTCAWEATLTSDLQVAKS